MAKPYYARWAALLLALFALGPSFSLAEVPTPSTAIQALLDLPLAKVEVKLGQWARYRVHSDDGTTPDRETVVGLIHRSAPFGAAWLEIQTQFPDETPVAWRMQIRLLDGSGKLGAFELKIADHPPLAVDPPVKNDPPPPVEKRLEAEERLETPAGAFNCRRVTLTSPDGKPRTLWISADAPFGGLVKAKEGETELLLIDVQDHGFMSHFNEEETISLTGHDHHDGIVRKK